MSVIHSTLAAEACGLGSCQLSTALRLHEHLVWEVILVVHSIEAPETSDLSGYVSCPQHSDCRNIRFGRLCQFSTAL